MYVVYLEAPEGDSPFEQPFKAFSRRYDAAEFATDNVRGEADKAFIFEVTGTDDARNAVQAVRMGRAKFVDARLMRASEVDLGREFDRAVAGGSKTFHKYILKYLGLTDDLAAQQTKIKDLFNRIEKK